MIGGSEGEKQRRRTVIATTSPRASAKVPGKWDILDPATVYCAELSCSLAWLRSIGHGGAFTDNDAPCWDSCMRSAPESTWIGDPEVVNYAKITDKPVRSVLANRSKFLRLPFPRESSQSLRPCDPPQPSNREFEEISKGKKKVVHFEVADRGFVRWGVDCSARETGNRRSLISYLASSRAKFHFDDGAPGDFYPVCQHQPAT